MKRLRYIRIAVAVAVIFIVTVCFAYPEGVLADFGRWLERVQFFPALLAGSGIILAVIIITTLIFGRLYCSIICPLGIYMDCCLWAKRKVNKMWNGYRWIRPYLTLRYTVLTAAVFTAALGIMSFVVLLDPYEIYHWLSANGLHFFTGKIFHPDYMMLVMGIAISAFRFLLITLMALLWGRMWCNTACPVGALLGILANHSLFRIRINNLKCTSCGECEKKCKATCISSEMKYVDTARCVSCFDCLGTCKYDALTYLPDRK